MEIAEITAESIRKEEDAELLNLHRHLHGLWAQHFEGNDQTHASNLTREDLVNAHVVVRDEMARRRMRHAAEPRDGLDEASCELKALPEALAESHEDVMLVPRFVAVTGSVGEGRSDPLDLDVLIRADRVEGQGGPGFFVRAEDVELPLRKRLDPDKTGLGIHWNANPQGPHDTHLALADLILRWRNPPERMEAKARHRRDRCMLCDKPPTVEVLWAEGMGHAWFCDDDYKQWKSEHPGEVDAEKKVEYGIARKKFSDRNSPKSLTDGETKAGRRLRQMRVEQLEKLLKEGKEFLRELEDILSWAQYADTEEEPVFIIYPFGKAMAESDTTSGGALVPPEQRLRLDLGSGEDKPDGYVSVDRRALPGVDLVLDLSKERLPYSDATVDEVRASHVLEDLKPEDRITVMREIWRVLKPGGVFRFEVPHTESAGAEMPFHLSHWTEETFRAFADPKLVEAYDLPSFEVVELETVDAGQGRRNVQGEMRPVKAAPGVKAVQPIVRRVELPKPQDKFFTDHFSPDELWNEWARDRAPVFVELKYNGFRSLVQKAGDRVSVFFEDSQKERDLPGLTEALEKIGTDFMLDANVGVTDAKGPWSRARLMALNADKPELPKGARVVLTAFDVIYWGEDVTKLPFIERRKLLAIKVGNAFSGKPGLEISQGRQVGSLAALAQAYRRLGRAPGSEGLVAKTLDASYPWGKASTPDWSKIKNVLEVKALVLDVKRTKDGKYNFRGGLLAGSSEFKNTVERDGRIYVDLDWSFNASFLARAGDIVTFEVEEIILQANGDLAWLGAKPVDVDGERKEPYAAIQVVSMARRAGVLQDARGETKALREEETRNEIAERLWAENWPKLVAKGEGRFILHGHFPALDADQKDLPLEKLLAAGASYHTDRRHEAPAPFGAWGFTDFEGKSEKVGPKGTRLYRMPPNEPMRGTFKLEQPKEWLEVAKKAPYISEGVGRTGKDFAKFFALDWGRYKLTFAREHSFEVVYDGEKGVLDGRYQINYVPVQGGGRIWMTVRPEDQKAIYADEHDLEKVVKELRDKGQKWLFWRDSLDAPLRKIDVTKKVTGGKNHE